MQTWRCLDCQRRVEISQYENAIFIGPIDSCWRLWSFPTHDQSPVVYSLNYHELRKQPFVWAKNITDIELHHRLENAPFDLMAWFDYNKRHPNGHNKELLFVDFPEHFTFSKRRKQWAPRCNIETIGCMYLAYPGQGGAISSAFCIAINEGVLAGGHSDR